MNLEKHITYLLQFHECVIVPEFGGFISNYIPAQFDQTKNTFFPPSKEIVFNTKINRNDGLLIDRIVENEKIGYHEATTLVLNFVDQLNSALHRGEKIKLAELGSFELDHSGTIIFESKSNFNLVEAYGLTEFSFPTINELQNKSKFSSQPVVRSLNNKKDLLKIAASITLLLALSVFPLKTDKLSLQSSNLNPIEFLSSDFSEKGKSVAVDEINSEKNTEKETLAVEVTHPYLLIGGYFQYESNAKQLNNEISAKGYQSEIVKLENGFYRVIIDSFDTKNEAYNALKAYKVNTSSSDAWVSVE